MRTSDKPKVFNENFKFDKEHMPQARSHARAKLIYNILRAMCYMSKDKRNAALDEIKDVNPELYQLVKGYWQQLTPQDIRFFKGDRPHFHEDGKLAIYHPQFDNPVLQVVLAGEDPIDSDEYGERKSKLVIPKEFGGIL